VGHGEGLVRRLVRRAGDIADEQGAQHRSRGETETGHGHGQEEMKALCLILLLGLAAVRGRGEAQPPPRPASPAPSMGPANPTQEALDTYAELTGRTVLQSGALRQLPASIKEQMPADKNSAITFIESELAKNQIEVVPDGEVFARVMPLGWRNSPLERQLASLKSPPTHEPKLATNICSFPAVDLNTFLSQFYAPFAQRTILRAALPSCTLRLQTMKPLTHEESIYAFKTILILNGIAAIDDGDKFVQVVRLSTASSVNLGAPKPEPGAEVLDPKKIPAFVAPQMPRPPVAAPQLTALYVKLFRQAPPWTPHPVDRLAAFYAELTDRKAVSSRQLGTLAVFFEVGSPLTKPEVLYAVETSLALNNLAIVPVDEKTIRVGYISERRKLGKDSPATAKLP
jgi:hypothetical protein